MALDFLDEVIRLDDMRETIELIIHFLVTLIKLSRPGGAKVVMAESLAVKQQLIVLKRNRKRAPKLTTSDRFKFGFLAFFINGNRLKKISIIIKPATILRFHKALVKRKYSRLYFNKMRIKPDRKPLNPKIISLIIEIKNSFVQQLKKAIGEGETSL